MINKSIAVILSMCMLSTNFICNVDAHSKNNEKKSSFGSALKNFLIPAGFCLGSGFIIGSLMNKMENDDKEEFKDNVGYLHYFLNIDENIDIVKHYIEFKLPEFLQHEKFEKHNENSNNKVVIVRNMCGNFTSLKIDYLVSILNLLRDGSKIVFMGDIISDDTNPKANSDSLSCLLCLAELQRCYPGQVIILKGRNESLGTGNIIADSLYHYLREKGMNNERVIPVIKAFLNTLPLACEVQTRYNRLYLSYNGPEGTLSEEELQKLEASFGFQGNINQGKENDEIPCFPSLYPDMTSEEIPESKPIIARNGLNRIDENGYKIPGLGFEKFD